mgnify:CR=1 FL=1
MDPNYRMERIERLLKELEYEVTRGMIENEIDEEITFRFIVPRSRKIPNGFVACEFSTRPKTSYDIYYYGGDAVKLKLVGKE